MAKRIERVLTTDPGMGIIRHADAGYDEAKEFARKSGVRCRWTKNEHQPRRHGGTERAEAECVGIDAIFANIGQLVTLRSLPASPGRVAVPT